MLLLIYIGYMLQCNMCKMTVSVKRIGTCIQIAVVPSWYSPGGTKVNFRQVASKPPKIQARCLLNKTKVNIFVLAG